MKPALPTSGRQHLPALLLTLSSALILLATVGTMVAGTLAASHRATRDLVLLKTMAAKAQRDIAQVAPLEQQRKRQTEARLRRAERQRVQAGVVAIAAVLFLLGAKWTLALSPPALPRRDQLATARTTTGTGVLNPPSQAGSVAEDLCSWIRKNSDFRKAVRILSNPATAAKSWFHGPAPHASAGWLPGRRWRSWLGFGSDTPLPARPESSTPACQQDRPAAPEDLIAIHQFVDQFVQQHGRGRELAIPALQALQQEFRYVPTPALERLCAISEMTPAQVAGVESFYTQFRRQPAGEHTIQVCHGTACHVAGAARISEEIHRQLGIAAGADTDPARRFTIEPVACLGCCTLAPVARADGATHGHLTTDQIAGLLERGWSARRNGSGCNGAHRNGRAKWPRQSPGGQGSRPPDPGSPAGELRIGLGSCCVAGGSAEVYDALQAAVLSRGVRVAVKRVGCVGMCHQTPLVEAIVPGRQPALYTRVAPQQARAIVSHHFRPPRLVSRLRNRFADLCQDLLPQQGHAQPPCQPMEPRDPQLQTFLAPQKLIATEYSGQIDPTDLDEYLRHGGFRALRRCANTMTPEKVIEQIAQSGLRGRGGGGFPAGQKWRMVRQAPGDPKYVVCNGDEGDPGAFMDRMLMESYPYRILEGLAIAAYAVGARAGIFYIRAEYPLAVQRIRAAIAACRQRGLLDHPYRLKLRIVEGAGAFICGEETALLKSIEGQRAAPRLRPPYPVEKGLWDQPTLINNVETLATVPWIIRHGPDEFAAIGTATSKGTKVFALTGKIKRGGLIEVPMGMTIAEIVYQIGGGIKDGGEFKAVQIGGPSGGCVPAELADTPVDYEALGQVGAIMGSGGLVVLDQTDCMVDIARYFLAFTQRESCGKCTHCRIGTRRMLDILDRICAGRGRQGDLRELEQLGRAIGSGSLCGLGKTAPNPVLTTLRYFRDEYQAHLEGRCPAGCCSALIAYRVTDSCIGCTICAQICPADAIPFVPYQRHTIDPVACIRCDQCRVKCPEQAIVVE